MKTIRFYPSEVKEGVAQANSLFISLLMKA
jgi:hypothetical protein